jgi:hypothetical protein
MKSEKQVITPKLWASSVECERVVTARCGWSIWHFRHALPLNYPTQDIRLGSQVEFPLWNHLEWVLVRK